MTFSELRLSEPLVRAVEAAGYETPTPIQRTAIPHVLSGRDVLGIAQTGTGKTAAFALPILQRLLDRPVAEASGFRPLGARALVLSPTRELAEQVFESFRAYARFTPLRCAAVVGGVHQFSQVQALKAGVDVLIATPGRLIDLMEQRVARLTLVEVLVLDEADRMLDIGFLPAIRRIAAHVPEDRQALLFSATMPGAIRSLADEILHDPAQVQVTPTVTAAETVEHWVHFVDPDGKPALLAHLLRDAAGSKALVFSRTKRGADKVARSLQRAGVKAIAMHSDREQSERTRALAAFRDGRVPVLVATDVAARGLHVDDVAIVVNYDLPNVPETYVHRIGRTGRAGASGKAVSFCTPTDRGDLRAIERLIRTPLKPADDATARRLAAAEPPPAARRARGCRRAAAHGADVHATRGRAARGHDGRNLPAARESAATIGAAAEGGAGVVGPGSTPGGSAGRRRRGRRGGRARRGGGGRAEGAAAPQAVAFAANVH